MRYKYNIKLYTLNYQWVLPRLCHITHVITTTKKVQDISIISECSSCHSEVNIAQTPTIYKHWCNFYHCGFIFSINKWYVLFVSSSFHSAHYVWELFTLLHISVHNYLDINSKGLGEMVAFHCIPKFPDGYMYFFQFGFLCMALSWTTHTSVSKTIEVISLGKIARNCMVNICVIKLTLLVY